MTDKPIYVLNALWIKKDGGMEKYQRYIDAVGPILNTLGTRLIES
jgi:hypothetical protein